MKRYSKLLLTGLVLLVAITVNTCGSGGDKDKIPLTTESGEAEDLYLKGRDLSEKLRYSEAREYYQKAVEVDPDFAVAHLSLAFVQPNTKGFYVSVDRALALIDQISEGERLWILSVEAGYIERDVMKQRGLLEQLVRTYPNDERSHSLLAHHYFEQQEYDKAIEQYQNVIDINPDFSQVYNQLGYAYRFTEQYEKAEKAFKKYIDLIPDDPNPYDSYAEFLMKMGRFDESIQNYEKALKASPYFYMSHIGISSNLMLKGQHEAAREQLRKMYLSARDGDQRRIALTATAITYVDEGEMDKAIEELEKRYAIAEADLDTINMSGDVSLIGVLLWEMGELDESVARLDQGLELMMASSASGGTKELAEEGYVYNMACIFAKEGDFESAKKNAQKFESRSKARRNPARIKYAHELNGIIALAEGDYDTAIIELNQASQLNPHNLYRLAQAYEGKGDKVTAKALFEKAANANISNSLPYALIRLKARAKSASM